MAIQRSRQADIGNDEKKMKGIKPSDLIIPGASVLILLILTLFVYIPSITEANKMREEIKGIKQNQDILQANLEAIQPLIDDQTQLQIDLRKTKRIIPQKLEVGDFSYYVDRLARESGLEFVEISTSNSSKSTGDEKIVENASVESYVSGVSGPIVYKGTYTQIVEFLDLLQRESPYIIEARKLEMDTTQVEEEDTNRSDDIWEVELSLMGYYIETESELSLAQMYTPIVPYTKFPQYLEIFESKASILDEEVE